MAEIIQEAQQEFWRSPTTPGPVVEVQPPVAAQAMAEACAACGTEFMIGARFCHTCGRRRPMIMAAGADAAGMADVWVRNVAGVRAWLSPRLMSAAGFMSSSWQKVSLPGWLHYLHFHEIKRWIGLSTASLIAFIVGLGCAAGAIGVSLFYRASNLAEFQAIQMWRIEWLLAATASFVAGILLKRPSDGDKDRSGKDGSNEHQG